MGLFDFIKEKINANREYFLSWQRLVSPDSPNKIIFTLKQLRYMTLEQAKNDLRIIQDSSKLIEKTTKPDVFFMRLNLLVEKTNHLAALNEYVKFSDISSKEIYNNLSNDYHEAINQFLWRYFSDTFDKAEKMKTEKGRIGKYQKFYDSLQQYYCYMNNENIKYIEAKYRAHIKP